MSSSLIILCPNGRRVNVKISNNSPLLNALSQACDKQGYKVDNYELRRGKTVVDLSQPFRFSGLTNNAKLEMVQTTTPRNADSEVTVSVQTESNDRVQGTFLSSASLWDVLHTLELTHPPISEDVTPCVVYMRVRVTGEHVLKNTTLRELGMSSGRVSIRFMLIEPVSETSNESSGSKDDTKIEDKEVVTDKKPSERERIENKMEVTEKREIDDDEVKSKPPLMSDNHGNIEFPVLPFSVFPLTDNQENSPTPMEADTPTNQAKPRPLEPHPPDEHFSTFTIRQGLADYDDYGKMILAQVMSRQKSQEVVYDDPCDRHPVIFSLDDPVPVTIADVPDDFYEHTITDVQKMHQDLQKDVKQLADAPLMTQELRNAKKRCEYRQTVIRVIMPDRMVLQGAFNTGESLKSLVKFVREHLRNEKLKFVLYTTPPKEVLKSAKATFSDKGFYPAANIHLSVTEGNEGGMANEEGVASECPLLSDTSITQYRKELIQAEEQASKHRVLEVNKDSNINGLNNTGNNSRIVSNKGNHGNHSQQLNEDSKGKPSSASKAGQNLPKWFTVGRK